MRAKSTASPSAWPSTIAPSPSSLSGMPALRSGPLALLSPPISSSLALPIDVADAANVPPLWGGTILGQSSVAARCWWQPVLAHRRLKGGAAAHLRHSRSPRLGGTIRALSKGLHCRLLVSIGKRPAHRVGDDGLGEAFDALRRHRRQDEALVEFGAQRLGHENIHLVHAGERLHARGKVHGAAEKREFPAIVRADEAREAEPAMDADADRERRQAFAVELGIVVADRRAHGKGGAHGIVALPGIRLERAEIGDDAVADIASDLTAMLVDRIAHALVVAIEYAHQDGGLKPLAHRGEADEIDEHRGRHLALGHRAAIALHAVGDEPLHDAGRRQARAGALKMLEIAGRGLELRPQVLAAPPFAVEQARENRREHQCGTHDDGRDHGWSITMAPMRQRPLPSDATPMASRNCGPDRRSRSARARRWIAAGSYQIVSRVKRTSKRSISSSWGASRWVRI